MHLVVSFHQRGCKSSCTHSYLMRAQCFPTGNAKWSMAFNVPKWHKRCHRGKLQIINLERLLYVHSNQMFCTQYFVGKVFQQKSKRQVKLVTHKRFILKWWQVLSWHKITAEDANFLRVPSGLRESWLLPIPYATQYSEAHKKICGMYAPKRKWCWWNACIKQYLLAICPEHNLNTFSTCTMQF